MSIDPDEFRAALGQFPTGVTVVTAAGDEGADGMTIGSFASVSLEPPLVMFCPTIDSTSWLRMKATRAFCVNVLSDSQADLCGLFASSSDDKFAEIPWTTDVTGSPLIPDCLAWIDCEIHDVHPGGDHDIVVGLVKSLRVDDDGGEPLVFSRGRLGSFTAL